MSLKKYSELTVNENTQNIGLFINGSQNGPRKYNASVYIRLLQIFDAISQDTSFTSYIIDYDDLKSVEEDIDDNNFLIDIVIVQREVLDYCLSKKLINYCNIHDIKIIYEIDDDLINIDKSHRDYDYYSKKAEVIKYVISNSNQVTVSTEKLKDKLIKYSDKIEVIPNTVVNLWDDGNLFKSRKNNLPILKIGYMGTVSHEKDIKIIEASMGNVIHYFLGKGTRVVFELIGGTMGELKHAKPISIPPNSTIYPNFVNWLKGTVDWDIAIAPLEENNINESKSGIKYLEYTALGVPGIYSAVGPYKEIIEDGKNGILVKENNESSWTENMIKLLENKKLQNDILVNSKNDVQKNYNMDCAVNKWKMILNNNKKIKVQKSDSKIKKIISILSKRLKG